MDLPPNLAAKPTCLKCRRIPIYTRRKSGSFFLLVSWHQSRPSQHLHPAAWFRCLLESKPHQLITGVSSISLRHLPSSSSTWPSIQENGGRGMAMESLSLSLALSRAPSLPPSLARSLALSLSLSLFLSDGLRQGQAPRPGASAPPQLFWGSQE